MTSHYPHGFANGVAIRGVPIVNAYGGNVFWVDSAHGSNGYKGTVDRPFATLDYAIGRCTANNGDLILIKANHAETITGVGGIAFDVAGITVIGMGQYNQRPRFLMDGGTTVTATVSAADVTVQNCVFAGGHNGIVTCFDVTATGFMLLDNEFEDNTTNEHFLEIVKCTGTTDNECDGLTVVGNKWYTPDSGPTAFVEMVSDVARGTFTDNIMIADAATGVSVFRFTAGKSTQGIIVARNKVVVGNTANAILVNNNQSDNTGLAFDNYVGHHDEVGMDIIDCDGIREFVNLSSSTDNTSGILQPAADTIT